MDDFIQFSVRIPCPAQVLWWIISILLTGTSITAVLMHEASRFAVDASGKPVRLQRLHRIMNSAELQNQLDSLTPQARGSLRKQLRIDFIFMPFAYLMMCFISLLILKITCDCSAWIPVLSWLCGLPFAVWLFDLLENLLMVSLLHHFEAAQPYPRISLWLMASANVLKWALVASWLLIHLSHGISSLILQRF